MEENGRKQSVDQIRKFQQRKFTTHWVTPCKGSPELDVVVGSKSGPRSPTIRTTWSQAIQWAVGTMDIAD
jgi:hypothetical protein